MRASNSIKGRLSLLFIALFLLVTISVGATYWGIQAQKADALVINLAGRQRMLTQKMVWLALSRPHDPELAATIRLFDQTLQALRDGGPVQPTLAETPGATGAQTTILAPAPDPELRAELDQAAALWATFRSHLEPVDSAALQAQAPVILARLDSVVSLYENRARAKLFRVQVIQALSFMAGYLLTRRRIFQPLLELRSAARRMSQGELSQPVPNLGEDELGELGNAFETMRAEISAAQDSLETRVAQRTRELATAFEFSQEIVSQLELEDLLQSVIDRARSLLGAKTAALCLLEPDPSALVLVASSGEGGHPAELRQPLDNDPAFRVINAGETVVVEADCTHCQFLLSHSPGTCAVAPLRAGDTTLGALCVVRSPSRPIDADETRALTLLANTATIAISNARLVEASRRQAEQAAILSERQRLAAELHDNLAQTLSFMSLKVDQIRLMLSSQKYSESSKELEAVKSAISNAYAQVRSALVGLSQPTTTKSEFAIQLASGVSEIHKMTGLQVELLLPDDRQIPLSRLAQSQAMQIVREALTNVHRHARARQAWVRVTKGDGQIQISIEDDGVGFDPQMIIGMDHMGLRLMRERAERSGGCLTVESTPGEGTRVELSYPLETSN